MKEEKQVFVKPREGDELVIVVNHSPNAREIRCTKAISSQIPGYMGCGCNLCTGWEGRNRKKKNEDLMRNAGL